MRLLDSLLGRPRKNHRESAPGSPLLVEALENREVLDATAMLAGTTLNVLGGATNDLLLIVRDAGSDQLIVSDSGREVIRVASGAVTDINVNAGDGNDVVVVQGVPQNATLNAGGALPRFNNGGDVLIYRGLGNATLIGGPGDDRLVSSVGNDILSGNDGSDVLFGDGGLNTLTGGAGPDRFYGFSTTDTITDLTAEDFTFIGQPPFDPLLDPFLGLAPTPDAILTTDEVNQLLQRASAATRTNDAIIAIVDRSGRPLGILMEDGVDPAIKNDVFLRVFAIDGALAKARVAAFLGNNQAPLTSRTFQTTSETTLTQREIESYPSITDPNSTLRGPGFVGPLGLNNHFPRGAAFAPQVDQFAIEHTNRDSIFAVGPDNIRGANNGFAQGDDVQLQARFNVNPAFIPSRILTPGQTSDPFGRSQQLAPPDSYGVLSGLQPHAQPRGLATLPGGLSIFKNGLQVGGIGVFFPGKTGFATEENSALNTNFDPNKPDRSLEAEYIAFAALGGSSGSGFTFGALGGVPPLPGFDLPFGRIDLVGITLDVFGPKGLNGPGILFQAGQAIGEGTVNGTLQPLIDPGPDNLVGTPDDGGLVPLLNGTIIPEGWLVMPHDAADGSITADDVRRMTLQSVQQALVTRAAIRLPMDSFAKFMITVTDKSGEVLGQFRMPDATVFSIDVSTAKARNAAYYADPAALSPADTLPGFAPGLAFTARTFRYLALPRFPEGIDGGPPGPFSQLNDDPGIDRTTPYIVLEPRVPQELTYGVLGTGLQVGPRQPASRFQSVLGFDAFNPGTNFHDFRDNGARTPADPGFFQNNLLNRNGIVFFPGSSAVYKNGVLVGGFGISGDGVDQDDIVTAAGVGGGFEPPDNLRADFYFFQGVRLPYMKFNRQPNINQIGDPFLGNQRLPGAR